MALFGKKNNAKTAAPEPAANVPADDFSPEALAALAASIESEEGAAGSSSQVRRPVGFKNGSALGLNIGTDTIKAVELTAKNGVCSITGIGIAPTPADSISNGVVLSVNLLGEAIRNLLANSGIKNRRVVTSVSGTGEVIVRVIEVPTMSDAELAENIKTDIDRYIPFPPSEVQWDAASMRDLPSDPNATNMDVLLVAARHELIDLHLELLESIKLDPRAIDVEPLAAARAIAGPLTPDNALVDYNDVCAILDIGANSTDISILRGDELVFTRTLPIAGNMITQKLMDELGLPHDDAERMKRELADALPVSAAPSTPAATDDFFSGESDDDIFSIDEEPVIPEAGETPAPDVDTDAEATADPFDLDFFNQGSQSEPGEQHQQKMPGDNAAGDADDTANPEELPSLAPEEKPVEDEDAALPSLADDTDAPAPTQPAAGGAISSFFDFDEEELDPQSEQLPTIQGQPQHTEAPPREEEPDYISADDDSFLPSLASSSEPGTPLPSAFAFPGDDIEEPAAPSAELSTPDAPAAPTPTPESTFAPLSFESLDVPEAAPAEEESTFADIAQVTDSPQSPEVEDEIDLSDILGDEPAEQPAIDIIDEGLGSSIDVSEETGLGGLADDLSAGLEIEEKPQDEEAVNNVLQPILDDLTNELRRSLEYHSARYPDSPVTRLVLIGGGAKLRNLDAYFAQNLGIPTSIGNPLAKLTLDAPQVDPRLIEEHGHAFVTALGLALREITK